MGGGFLRTMTLHFAFHQRVVVPLEASRPTQPRPAPPAPPFSAGLETQRRKSRISGKGALTYDVVLSESCWSCFAVPSLWGGA